MCLCVRLLISNKSGNRDGCLMFLPRGAVVCPSAPVVVGLIESLVATLTAGVSTVGRFAFDGCRQTKDIAEGLFFLSAGFIVELFQCLLLLRSILVRTTRLNAHGPIWRVFFDGSCGFLFGECYIRI